MIRIFTFSLTLFLGCQVNLFAQTQIGQTLLNIDDGDRFGCCLALSSDGTRLVTSAPGIDLFGTFGVGMVEVFEFHGNQWVKLGQTIEGENIEFAQLGRGVGMSPDGSRIAAGNNNTKAKVFEWNSSNSMWEQMGEDLEYPLSEDARISEFWFTADGNTMLTGASSGGGDSVIRWQWNGSNWVQQGAAIILPDRVEFAISSDASRIAVQYYGGSEGIHIYDFDGSNWSLIHTITVGSGFYIGDGFDLSADGNRLIYGVVEDQAPTNLDGVIITLDNINGTWTETRPQIPVLMTSWNYGLRMSDDGRKFIYGSGEENTPLTSLDGAFVYEDVNGSWLLLHQFSYDNYDETINDNVDITPDGNIVAFGQSIPFSSGFIEVYDISDLTVSTEEFTENDQHPNVFPNPSNGQFTIQLNQPLPDISVKVLNAQGSLIQEFTVQHQKDIPLEIKGPVGVYSLTLTGKSFSKTLRVIKQD